MKWLGILSHVVLFPTQTFIQYQNSEQPWYSTLNLTLLILETGNWRMSARHQKIKIETYIKLDRSGCNGLLCLWLNDWTTIDGRNREVRRGPRSEGWELGCRHSVWRACRGRGWSGVEMRGKRTTGDSEGGWLRGMQGGASSEWLARDRQGG